MKNRFHLKLATAFLFIIHFVATSISAQQAPAQLRVVSKSPVGTLSDLRQCQEIVVTFNQPMVALEAVPEAEGPGPLSIVPPIRGKYRWRGTSTLVFVPRDTIPYATEYTLRVPAGTKSLSGALLTKDEAWRFESPRPTLVSSQPWDQQTQVDLRPMITLTFNQPVNPVTAGPFIKLSSTDPSGKRVPIASELRRLTAEEAKRYGGRTDHILVVQPKKLPALGPEFITDDFSEGFYAPFKTGADKLSAFLAQGFSAQTKQALSSYDTRYPPEYQLKTLVVQDINKAIKGPSLYDQERFVAVKLSPAMLAMAKEQLTKDNLQRFNRILVIKAYDKQLDRQSKLPQERTVKIELLKGLPGMQGKLGLAETKTVQFSTYRFFKFVKMWLSDDNDPLGWLNFEFTNPIYHRDLLASLTVTPKVKFPNERSGEDEGYDEYYGESSSQQPYARLDFKPETSYQIKISGQLKDIYGQALGRDIELTLATRGYTPAFDITTGNGVLEAYLPAYLPATVMNWPSVRLKMAAVPLDSVVPLLMEDGWTPGWNIDETWNLQIKRNIQKRLPLDLKRVLSNENTGFAKVALTGLPPDGKNEASAFVQVTNMGLTGKFSPDNSLVWVTRLKDCQPVSGAEVQIRDDKNRLLFKGKTDKNGACLCPGWEELGLELPQEDQGDDYYYGSRPRLWALVSKGKDRAVLVSRWGMGIEPYEFGISYDWNPKPVQYQGHIFTERGLYRAGEKVFIKGVFRQKRRGQWEIPARRSMTLTVKDSRDEEIASKTVRLSDWGSFAFTLQLKADAPTGFYSINAANDSVSRMSGYASFRVEAFEPAQFEVNATTASQEYIAGDLFQGTIAAKYLFGATMSGEDVSWALRTSPYYYMPNGRDDYSFNDTWWWDDYRDYGSLLASKEGKLDQEGKTSVEAKLDLGAAKSTMAVTLEGTVTSKNRQSMSGRRQAVVHRGEFYLGLKQNSSFIDLDKPLKLNVISVKPDGSMYPGQRADIEVIRRQWISVRQAGVGGRYEWRSELKDSTVAKLEATTGQEPQEVNFTPTLPGFYIIKAKAQDQRGNTLYNGGYFYAVGAGFVSWEMRNDDKIDLVADKTQYKPGDVATIMVKSPYPSTKALVTVEREYVIQHQVLDLAGSAPTLDIPITTEHLPNIFVSVILIQGRLKEQKYSKDGDDLSKPAFKIGYLNLPVDPGTKRLNIEVKTDRPGYAPRDSVGLDLVVRNFQNQPALAEVTLAVVDKGVLNLIDFQTPNSFDAFYGQRPLSVETAETRMHVIGQRNYGEKGENRGGGGGMEIMYRGDFQTTPFYRSAVYTDKDGKLSARFKLPDNLTAFKVMATAHTKESQFGAGDNAFTVSKPILMLESMPRFLRVGDSLLAGVTVHNNTGAEQQVEVKAEAMGVDIWGPTAQTVDVKPNQPVEVRFGYKAKALGEAVFRFSAVTAEGKDGLEVKAPVIMPKITEAVALYDQTEDRASQALKVPEKIWQGVGGLEVSTASTALVGLETSLDYLINYPYGCLEQTMSSLMPMILSEDIVTSFGLAPKKAKDIKSFVRAGITKLYTFQRPDGGFGLWPDSYYSSPYLTCYALVGFARAKAKGYEVDAEAVDRATRYLKAELANIMTPEKLTSPYSINCRMTVMAYEAYALALWGKADGSALDQLYTKRDQLSLYGQAMLLRAYAQMKLAPAKREDLAQMLFNRVKVAPTTWHFEETQDHLYWWIYQSNARTTALVLATLLEAKGQFENSEKIVKWLMEARRAGRWQCTQDNITAFEALDKYFNLYEKDQPSFTAKVKVEGKEILKESFQGRELTLRKKSFALTDFKAGKELPVEISKEGTGRLYYGLRMVYAPLEPVRARDEGFAVSKKFTTVAGDTVVKEFKAGQTYKVVLTVTTAQERHYAVVDDPLPAGFLIVNTSFATASQEQARQAGHTQDYEGPDGWWWGSFNHFEIYDDRVLLFADQLNNGQHTYSYLAKAMYPGRYYLPQTKAEEMYSPEVFGWCPDGVVVVK